MTNRNNKTNRLAVFDIDGTIFRSSLVIELSHSLVDAGVFPKKARAEIATEYLAWLDRKGTYEAYIDKVVKIYLKHITGQRYTKVKRIAEQVIKFQKDRVYRFTRDLIKKLKKEHYLLVAISGSPSYIVEAYAKTIGFDLFFGTELEIRPVRSQSRLGVGTADARTRQTSNGVKDGYFTGKVLNLDSAYNKAKIVKSLAAEYGASLKRSLVVGDTEGDIPMLSLVGNPIAFNPNLQLAKVAKKRGWRVVAERKDVIFDLKNYNFVLF